VQVHSHLSAKTTHNEFIPILTLLAKPPFRQPPKHLSPTLNDFRLINP